MFIHIHSQFSVIVHQLFDFHLFFSAFVQFVQFDYSLFDYLFIPCIFCPDTGMVFQVFRSYKPSNNNHPAGQ